MPEFEKEVLKLKAGHTWTCKPGYRICVLDQGAVRFDLPQDWVMKFQERSVQFYDLEPPDDNCRLEVSVLHHSQIDWTGLPLDQLLRGCAREKPGDPVEQGEIFRQSRPRVELVWLEKPFLDSQQGGKAACTRIALVRGANAHAVITFDFWAADADRVVPVWDEVMSSLDLGLKVTDPTIGERRM
jgi:hypothetical protein